jgi:hypothetical protein
MILNFRRHCRTLGYLSCSNSVHTVNQYILVRVVTVPIEPSIKPYQTLGALLFASILAINSSLVSLPVGCKFL